MYRDRKLIKRLKKQGFYLTLAILFGWLYRWMQTHPDFQLNPGIAMAGIGITMLAITVWVLIEREDQPSSSRYRGR